ncbi:hypothetical protein K502DRAFT_368941 [Neoconidiobolus thromboides FSU 785]|nr:hypothetical protein K502DRAFT_368941 [Neoconidiobolus thromboides FSU 785]
MDLHLDELSYCLLLTITLLLVYNFITNFSYDIHPSFILNQCITSPTRLKNESVVYRNRATPFSSDLTIRVSRQLNGLNDWLNTWINEAKVSVKGEVQNVPQELQKVGKSIKTLCERNLFIYDDRNSFESFTVFLASVYYGFHLNVIVNFDQKINELIKENDVFFINEIQLDEAIKITKDKNVILIVLDKEVASTTINNTKVISFKEFINNGSIQESTESNNNVKISYIKYNNNEIDINEFNATHIYSSISAFSHSFPMQFQVGQEDSYLTTKNALLSDEIMRIYYFLSKKVTYHIKPPKEISNSITIKYQSSEDLNDILFSNEIQFNLKSEDYENLYSTKPWSIVTFIQQVTFDFIKKIMQRDRHLLNNVFTKQILNNNHSKLRLLYTDDPFFPKSHSQAINALLGCQLVNSLTHNNIFGVLSNTLIYDYINQNQLGSPTSSLEFKIISTQEEPLDNTKILGKLAFKGHSSNKGNEEYIVSDWLVTNNQTESLVFYGSEKELIKKEYNIEQLPVSLKLLESIIEANCPYIKKAELNLNQSYLQGGFILREGRIQELLKMHQLNELDLNSSRLLSYITKTVQVEINSTLKESNIELVLDFNNFKLKKE